MGVTGVTLHEKVQIRMYFTLGVGHVGHLQRFPIRTRYFSKNGVSIGKMCNRPTYPTPWDFQQCENVMACINKGMSYVFRWWLQHCRMPLKRILRAKR